MLRGPSRRVSWVAFVGASAVVGVAVLALAPQRSPIAPVSKLSLVSASSKPDPRSCKPAPPVLVTLSSTDQAGHWTVHLEALATVESVEISLGATADGQDVARRLTWTGSLAQGETRDLEVAFEPPPDASDVWAEAAAGTDSESLLRGRAAIALRGGRPTATVEAAPLAGRLTIDPATGEKTVEFVGSTEGAP